LSIECRRVASQLLPRRTHPSASQPPFSSLSLATQAIDEVELLLRRDRAGCYVCMDEIFVFETTSFDIFCEKERWVMGRLILERGTNENGVGAGTCAWSLELCASSSTLTAGGAASLQARSAKDAAAASATSIPDDPFCQLGLELCLVGTVDGCHECMTRETALQTWKVVSPRSFVQRPSLGAIAEMCADEWSGSDDDGSSDLARALACAHVASDDGEVSGDEAGRGQEQEAAGVEGDCVPSASGSEVDGLGAAGGEGEIVATYAANSPWSMVPWKGEMSLLYRAEVLRNVRKRYEDLMHEYHATAGSGAGAASGAEDLFKGDLTWFSAGIRIGVGVGLGVCLGLGLGVGILVNGYKVSRDRLTNMQHALRYR